MLLKNYTYNLNISRVSETNIVFKEIKPYQIIKKKYRGDYF